MHYIVYGRESNLVVAALVAGLRKAGHKATVQRVELFRPNEAPRDAERVVVSGLRGKYTEVREHFRAAGCPVIVREAPHFRDNDRGAGDGTASRQQRLSLDAHAWIPPFPCPPDRFEALGLAVSPSKKSGRHLLVCGQTDRDTQHGKTLQEIAAWLAAALPVVVKATGLEPRWRPHPLAPDAPMPDTGMAASDPAETSLPDDLEGAGAVLTYNSTAGLTAIRSGIPVYCGGPATYRDLAHHVGGEQIAEPAATGAAAVRELMARVAYTQWTHEEIENGDWISTIEAAIKGTEPVHGHGEDAHDDVAHAAAGEVAPDVGALAIPTEQAIAAAVSHTAGPFSIRDLCGALDSMGAEAGRKEIRSELDEFVGAGVLEVVDPGGRGKARLWERVTEASP